MEYNLKPDEKATLQLRGLYEEYGYQKYKMGKFEEYSLYVNNRDFLAGDKVLTFTDLDGRLLAMKPDVTLSVINNTSATEETREKLYYIENVYRENKESHCFKEINQMGLEYLGNVDRYSILEVITLAARSLNEIDEDYLLEISNMDYVLHLLAGMDLSESSYVELLSGIRQKNQTGIQESAKRAGLTEAQSELLCSIPFLYGTMDETLSRAKEMAQNDEMRRDAEDLQAYCEALKNLGYGDKIQLDLSLVNDIDYYNGVIFRGYIRKLPGCVLAGGQYDKAMKILGKAGGAVGFAIYLDELTKGTQDPQRYDVDAVLLYSEKGEMTDVFMAVCALQEKVMSVSAQTSEDTELRYREKYVLRDGRPEMEAK